MKVVVRSVLFSGISFVILGGLYTGAVTVVSNLLFPSQAQGSKIEIAGEVVGSELLGQKITDARFFQGRPSASDYGSVPSGASNKGPTSQDLKDMVEKRRQAWGGSADVPAELLLASGSGVDPHISPETARFQIAFIERARGGTPGLGQRLQTLIDEHTEGPKFGFLGLPRVNVLRLNLALRELDPVR